MNDETSDAVEEWLAKAESDWEAVEILSANENCPKETMCFHC